MKFKTFLTLILSVATMTIATFSPLVVSAQGYSMSPDAMITPIADTIVPFYTYVQSASIGVFPSSTGTTYRLNITGISSVTSVSGTATLYKASSSGTYTKVDSETISLKGSRIQYTGYLKSNGSGKYKIEFTGTVKSSSSSESVTFRNYGSY